MEKIKISDNDVIETVRGAMPVVTKELSGLFSAAMFTNNLIFRGEVQATNENLDNAIDFGLYYFSQVVGTHTGTPNDHSTGFVVKTTSGAIIQILFNIRGKIFFRFRSTAGVWDVWKVVAMSNYTV